MRSFAVHVKLCKLYFSPDCFFKAEWLILIVILAFWFLNNLKTPYSPNVVVYILDHSQRGSLFTLFLYNPLMGFLSVCGLTSMCQSLWEKAQEFLSKVSHDIGQMLTSSRAIGNRQFDIFLSNYYVFYVINWSKFFKQVDKCKNEGMTECLFCFHSRSGFFAVLWRWVFEAADDQVRVLLCHSTTTQALPGKRKWVWISVWTH